MISQDVVGLTQHLIDRIRTVHLKLNSYNSERFLLLSNYATRSDVYETNDMVKEIGVCEHPEEHARQNLCKVYSDDQVKR